MGGKPTITLLSDFGLQDHYVGTMHAVIRQQSDCPIIDINHQIPPQDIAAASYTLQAVWDYLPSPTIVCAVVDPGVGSERKILFLEDKARGLKLIAPDNGIISQIARFQNIQVQEVLPNIEPQSNTFHGRDLFIPLALDVLHNRELKTQALSPILLPEASPMQTNQGFQGRFLSVDRFGNMVCNLHKKDLPAELKEFPFQIKLNGINQNIPLQKTFSEVHAGEWLAYWGSSEYLEIAHNQDSAWKAVQKELCLNHWTEIDWEIEFL